MSHVDLENFKWCYMSLLLKATGVTSYPPQKKKKKKINKRKMIIIKLNK